MKKVLRISLKIVFSTIILGFLTILFLKSDNHFPFKKESYLSIKEAVNNSEKLPEEFYNTYNDIKPMKNGNKYLFSKITGSNDVECPCIYVANISRMRYFRKSFINNIILGWKLEKQFTQRECLNLVVQEFDYVYGNIGIKNASKFYFEKELENLSTKEYQTLVVMLQNPSLYNPKRDPERLEAKLSEL